MVHLRGLVVYTEKNWKKLRLEIGKVDYCSNSRGNMARAYATEYDMSFEVNARESPKKFISMRPRTKSVLSPNVLATFLQMFFK